MSGSARFKITGIAGESPSSDRGYDAEAGETLTLELEDSTDIQKAEFFFVKRSVAARALTYPFTPSSGVLSGATAVQGGCTLDINATVPDEGVALWIRCEVNNGNDANGHPKDEYTFDRMVVVRNNGVRPPIAGEAYEYDPDDGWVPEIGTLNERVNNGGIGSVEAWPDSVVLTGTRFYEYAGEHSGYPAFALALTGHSVGATALLYIPADSTTLTGGEVFYPTDLDPSETFDPLIPEKAYVIAAQCLSTSPRVVIGTGKVAETTTAAPTVLSATINATNPNALVVVYSAPVLLPDDAPTGFSIDVIAGSAMTITALESGNGTATHTFTLSRDGADGDSSDLEIASAIALALNGGLLADDTVAISYQGFDATYEVPGIIAKYRGDQMTISGGTDVTAVADQIGAADLAAAGSATITVDAAPSAEPEFSIPANAWLEGSLGSTSVAGGLIIAFTMEVTAVATQGMVTLGRNSAPTTSEVYVVLGGTTLYGVRSSANAHNAGSTWIAGTGLHDVVMFIDPGGTACHMYIDGTFFAEETNTETSGNVSRITIGAICDHTLAAETKPFCEIQIGIGNTYSVTEASDYHAYSDTRYA